jgi:hypothetical protein
MVVYCKRYTIECNFKIRGKKPVTVYYFSIASRIYIQTYVCRFLNFLFAHFPFPTLVMASSSSSSSLTSKYPGQTQNGGLLYARDIRNIACPRNREIIYSSSLLAGSS